MTVLNFLKARKSEKIIQFLTWYLPLVENINVHEADTITLTPVRDKHRLTQICALTVSRETVTLTLKYQPLSGWMCECVDRHV